MSLNAHEKKELKFIFNTALEIAIAFISIAAIVLTIYLL